MANHLILDSDGGVDDAQALVMLVAHGRPPDLVTTVFGNVGLLQATENLLATLAVLGLDIPVHKGADRPLVQPIIDATEVHGEDGLGGAPRPARIGNVAAGHAVQALCNRFGAAMDRGEKADILLIGPLTNLALVLRLAPHIIGGIGRVTIMGGTLFGRGNTTAAAEFNIYADPEAAEMVFSADLDILVVPWEPCVTHAMTGAAVDAAFARIPPSPARDFSQALAGHLRRGTMGWDGVDELRLVDPLAAALLIAPDIIGATVDAAIGVSLAPGLTRGMTVIDPSGRLGTRKHRLVETVDARRLAELYAQSAAFIPPNQPKA